jgi:uncharacterized membrane protein YccC
MTALLAGQFAAGLYCGFTGTGIYAFPAGGPAFLQLTAFLGGPISNFVNGVIATVVGMAVTFILWLYPVQGRRPRTGHRLILPPHRAA